MKWSPEWIEAAAPAAAEIIEPRSWTPAEIERRRTTAASAYVSDAERAEQEAGLARHAELEEAFNRGFEEGHAEAVRQEAERVQLVVQSLEQAVAEVRAAAGMWTENAKEHVCALAIAVAQHVITREVKSELHVVTDLTRRALAEFPADEPVRVRMNPEDLSALTALAADPAGGVLIASGRNVQWQADESIKRGGCVVEGRGRVVDGRVDHALERIWGRLTE